MKRFFSSLLLVILVVSFHTLSAQTADEDLAGTYSDFITGLQLNKDGSFFISRPDIFCTHIDKVKGVWVSKGNTVTLNPDLQKRTPDVTLTENTTGAPAGEVRVRINYWVETYENEMLISKEPRQFDFLTLRINTPGNYHNLVRTKRFSHCLFAPDPKHQMIVDSTNTVTLQQGDVHMIGVFTGTFEKMIELKPANPRANYFEITIVDRIDKEGMPRNKKVLVKGKKAFYYEWNGDIDKNLAPLRKTSIAIAQ